MDVFFVDTATALGPERRRVSAARALPIFRIFVPTRRVAAQYCDRGRTQIITRVHDDAWPGSFCFARVPINVGNRLCILNRITVVVLITLRLQCTYTTTYYAGITSSAAYRCFGGRGPRGGRRKLRAREFNYRGVTGLGAVPKRPRN